MHTNLPIYWIKSMAIDLDELNVMYMVIKLGIAARISMMGVSMQIAPYLKKDDKKENPPKIELNGPHGFFVFFFFFLPPPYTSVSFSVQIFPFSCHIHLLVLLQAVFYIFFLQN